VGHVKELHQQMCALKEMQVIRMILYVEHTVDPNDLTVALWRFCNNLDPKRDNYLYDGQSSTLACMGFDGTIKTKAFDNFQRDWPNIIVMDETTIRAVDEKWSRLGLGEFLPSPSLKFQGQMYGEEVVAS
jgi:4-hydroxy-3-polyprenylbenzoate decarboxylase